MTINCIRCGTTQQESKTPNVCLNCEKAYLKEQIIIAKRAYNKYWIITISILVVCWVLGMIVWLVN